MHREFNEINYQILLYEYNFSLKGLLKLLTFEYIKIGVTITILIKINKTNFRIKSENMKCE